MMRQLQSDSQKAGVPNCSIPAGTPAWITSELIAQTLITWQPYYEEPLTVEQAIDMIRSVGRLYDALSGE